MFYQALIRKRTTEVFGDIYWELLKGYTPFLSDSSPLKPPVKNLQIVDSTSISLVSDILKSVGRNPINGKKKGGIKMYLVLSALVVQ